MSSGKFNMDLRCFGQAPRTWITELHYHKIDYILIAFSILMLVGGGAVKLFTDIGGFTVPDAFLKMVGVL